MQSVASDPDVVKHAWQRVLSSADINDKQCALRMAGALEDYATLLRDHKLRLLDAANAEARAKSLRAQFFTHELTDKQSKDWQRDLALTDVAVAGMAGGWDKQNRNAAERFFSGNSNPVARAAVIIFVSFSAGGMAFCLVESGKPAPEAKWEEVPARIVECAVDNPNSKRLAKQPMVSYTYAVDNTAYLSHTFAARGIQGFTRNYRDKWTSEHGPGTMTTCFVDVSNPRRACLVPPPPAKKNDGYQHVLAPLTGACTMALCFIVPYYLRRRFR